jgi:hypothetical protein
MWVSERDVYDSTLEPQKSPGVENPRSFEELWDTELERRALNEGLQKLLNLCPHPNPPDPGSLPFSHLKVMLAIL